MWNLKNNSYELELRATNSAPRNLSQFMNINYYLKSMVKDFKSTS